MKSPQTLRGSFSAVSTPIFASKRSLESSWRNLQDLHSWPISLLRLPTQSPVAQIAALVEKVMWLLDPPTENSRKMKKRCQHEKSQLLKISPRAARLHTEEKGGKRRKRAGTMAPDEDVNNPHTRLEEESDCILDPYLCCGCPRSRPRDHRNRGGRFCNYNSTSIHTRFRHKIDKIMKRFSGYTYIHTRFP